MPKHHVSSFFHVLTSNPSDFSYYFPHYTIYLFCMSQYEINKEERCCKMQTSCIINCRESRNIKKNLIIMCLCEPFVKLTPLAPQIYRMYIIQNYNLQKFSSPQVPRLQVF